MLYYIRSRLSLPRYLVSSVLLTLMLSLLSRLFLRGLYLLLGFDAQFSAIFKQITDASMVSPFLLLLLFSFLSLFCIGWLRTHGKGGRVLAALSAICLTVPGFVLAVCCTRVNGVLFGDVLRSLIPLLRSGAL